MRINSLVTAALVSLTIVGVASAADDAATSNGFAALSGVKAVPMEAAELERVKGMHVHFLDANGKFHLAGNFNGPMHSGRPNNGIGEGNWYLNGSPDGQLVHPSYHGLCVAGPILIPGVPSQCP